MASGILGNIQDEVTCPICLELLTEPLGLDCGHTFCQACISANNESVMGQEGESSCPVCRVSYQPGNLRPHRLVANIVEMLREVKLSPEEEQKGDLCVHHGEKLLLFCKEHGKFICWLCERSQEHRGHHTFLMEEIAQEYKGTLQTALERLRVEQQRAEELGADIREERTSWMNEMQNDRESVQDCFKQLRGVLNSEEQKELQKLEKEERDYLHDLEQDECEMAHQSQLLADLIWDLEHRLQGSTGEMLQDVNGIMNRSATFTLKKPRPFKKKQRRVFPVPDLRQMLHVFNELTGVRRYWVHMTLDIPKDKPAIVISMDRKQVRYNDCSMNYSYNDYYRKNTDSNYENYAVLGSTFITSEKHYWEVDVSEKREWVLGVHGITFNDHNMIFRKGYQRQHINTTYQPSNGYWVIGLQNRTEYKAFVDSSSSETLTLTLSLTVPPRRVGVFLDYQGGTVSFLNVTNHGFLIYKFSSCSFTQKLFPYFNPMRCTAPMTLCSPSS